MEYYVEEVNQLLGKPVEKQTFIHQYQGFVLIRLLQVLGAYGFRGLFERKAHFLTSIPLALKNFLHAHSILYFQLSTGASIKRTYSTSFTKPPSRNGLTMAKTCFVLM